MYNSNDFSTNSVHSETNQRLDSLLEPYFSENYRARCYPGLIFQQGKRKMVQINVPAGDFPALLQANPAIANDPDSGKNRPEVKGHAGEIKEYIVDRARKGKPWIVGTLTANVDPDKVKIIELGRGICLVVINRGVKLDITDGQHRKSAICELIEGAESELIGDNDFPITLVLEKDFHQCQADFRDMAQTRQLDKSLLLSFGEFEGQVGITKNLIEQVRMFQEKTEKINKMPGKKKLIYTTNYLVQFVSCVFAGEPTNELQGWDVEQSSKALAECLNKFFSECRDTKDIAEKEVRDLTIDNVTAFKTYSLLGVSVGLQVLGRLLYCTYNKDRNYFDAQKVSQLAQLDWSRKSLLWENNVVRKTTNFDYRVTTNPTAVIDAVKTVKTRLEWM